MSNHRLRSALSARGWNGARLAEEVGVDAKTVERWLTQGRRPHTTTRARVCHVLGHDETYFWPELLGDDRVRGVSQSEIVQLWPTRDSIPGDVWESLTSRARSRVEVLVHSGGFLVEVYRLGQVLRDLSAAGGQARVLLGDPGSAAVVQRGIDEALPTLPARAASTLEYLSPVLGLPGVEVRVHGTPLYASIYRFDDSMMVNLHTHGLPAKDNPVLQLQQLPGGKLFKYYEEAFDRVWGAARLP